MNYYSHHIGDYIRDTSHLSLLEHGVYRQLLDLYYLTEGNIPLGTQSVARRIRAVTREEIDALESVLSEFFEPKENGYLQQRCDQEIENYKLICERNKSNGQSGGRPKKTQSVPTGNPAVTQSKPSHYPLPITQEPLPKEKNTARARAIVKPVGVAESVWSDFLAIRKAKRSPLTETAIAGIEREAVKAGLTLGDALAMCCERGWQWFKAEWMSDKTLRMNIAAQTVPSRPGIDPALQKLNEDRGRVVPMPENVRKAVKSILGEKR